MGRYGKSSSFKLIIKPTTKEGFNKEIKTSLPPPAQDEEQPHNATKQNINTDNKLIDNNTVQTKSTTILTPERKLLLIFINKILGKTDKKSMITDLIEVKNIPREQFTNQTSLNVYQELKDALFLTYTKLYPSVYKRQKNPVLNVLKVMLAQSGNLKLLSTRKEEQCGKGVRKVYRVYTIIKA